MPYLATLAFGDPRGANYVRTTRDLSPLVLSSKENMFSLLPQIDLSVSFLVNSRGLRGVSHAPRVTDKKASVVKYSN